MSEINPNNKKFYIAIAFGIFALFLLLVVPCIVAMLVARYREKRQERRDALARELEEGQGDDAALPVPEDPILGYRVDEEDLPEASEQLQSKQDDAVAEAQGSQESVDSKKKRFDLDE
ncbi:uncharacterized protein Triagg1_4439 [Trichoderma aggressivum f. europaeum]|uniref:Uncharacterized protein n=1 Tax=Trichoderma aggressivum f. europaeum TaxID=173218 RepID=A0AAE1M5S4_9HYPO|nr:hypothetical protein Triagg1_4439 [Trichoderma aggressivum f. europaeum]